MVEKPLGESVRQSVAEYLDTMDDQEVSDLYALVLAEVEGPLLAFVLHRTGNNQSETSRILGLNRGTLRKKLRKYRLL